MTQEVESDVAGTLLRILAGEGAEVRGRAAALRDRRARRGTSSRPARRPSGSGRAGGRRGGARPRGGPGARPRRGPEPRRRRRCGAGARPVVHRRHGAHQGLPARPAYRAGARNRPRRVTGTGPDGRIVAEDVERGHGRPGRAGPGVAEPAAASLPAEDDEFETVKLTSDPQARSRSASPRPGRRPTSRSRSRPTCGA